MKLNVKRADLERILIVCAAALVVVLALRGGGETQVEMVYEEPPLTVAQTSAGASDVEMQSTVCWYEDGDGYLVPVTRQVPKQDGVAKATLALMVKSSENDLAAARMGLTNVIPEGVTFDLDISNGQARLDMSKEALNCASAEEELLMVHGAAATLCGFDTVQEVSFLFDGQKRSRLTHGTDVSGTFTADMVNMESVTTMASGYADQVQLYFPSASGRLLVPVTRTVFSPADISTAILELAKGPKTDSGLERPLPEGCGIKSVKVKNGTATIDFSQEFINVTQQDDGGQQAIRAVLFTASQFPGVKKVEILVDGQPYTPAPETATTFLNAADEVMAQYPGVIEID
ncbi:MAG: GerMN domain-containing protein [Clostridia bacterium]|nr:GerMN domain-containing protein [Clostridia bacterium]